MFHHRVENFFVADTGPGEPQLLRQRFLGAQSLARRNSVTFVQPLQLSAAGRCLEIFDNGDIRTFISQNFQCLARCSASRIMINCCLHSISVHLPFAVVPQRAVA